MKHYNPFKMWGSWVGFTIALIITAYGTLQCIGMCPWYIIRTSRIYSLIPFTYPILGFLLGWGIHSLVRKLKR